MYVIHFVTWQLVVTVSVYVLYIDNSGRLFTSYVQYIMYKRIEALVNTDAIFPIILRLQHNYDCSR